MKKSILSFLLASLLAIPAASHDNWTAISEKLLKSVVRVENKEGICSGFIINSAAPKDKDYVLTANHCAGEELTADSSPAVIKSRNQEKDLLVLEVDDTGRPPLFLAKDNPAKGQEVAALGYGFGFERPMFRVCSISENDTHIPEVGGPFILTNATFVSGQSGGPVVDTNGEVVMIVQRGTASFGIGVGAEVIKSKVGKWWEKKAKDAVQK